MFKEKKKNLLLSSLIALGVLVFEQIMGEPIHHDMILMYCLEQKDVKFPFIFKHQLICWIMI